MTLQAAIKAKNVPQIRKITKVTPVADIVKMLKEFTPTERVLYFRLLNTTSQSDIFAALDPDFQEELVSSFTDSEIKTIVGELYTDDIADLVEEVPIELAKRILSLATDKETKESINKILRYHDNQIGSIMSVDIVLLRQTFTTKKALETIKEEKSEARLAHYFCVVNARNQLVGYVALEDLVFAKADTKIQKLVRPVSTELRTTTHKEDAAIIFAEQDMSVLPVLNTQKEVVGMVFADDMIDVIKEIAIDDFRKFAGVSGTEEKNLHRNVGFYHLPFRMIWLLILMLSSTVASIFIDIFKNVSQLRLGSVLTSALVAIIPVVMDAAGNAGTQTSTLVIRGLAVGDITTKDYLKVVCKELLVSMLIGFSLAIFNFVRLIIYYSISGDIHDSDFILLAFTSSLALWIVIVIAKTVGSIIPLLAKKVGLDPALLSGPLITTVIDAVATLVLFGISIGILSSIGVI
ncbi:magnesium transporter [Mycoplasma sp. ATU-Cv-508]|uniref:magnesium transporter n=1 Tax=Mycoplasma sp. ATU-Cv-508 TaxID=2048001 RepID=UPI000FDD4C9B